MTVYDYEEKIYAEFLAFGGLVFLATQLRNRTGQEIKRKAKKNIILSRNRTHSHPVTVKWSIVYLILTIQLSNQIIFENI